MEQIDINYRKPAKELKVGDTVKLKRFPGALGEVSKIEGHSVEVKHRKPLTDAYRTWTHGVWYRDELEVCNETA